MKLAVLLSAACIISLLSSVQAGITLYHPLTGNTTEIRCMDVHGFKSYPNDGTVYTIASYFQPSHYGRVVFIDYTYIEDFSYSINSYKHLAELAAEEKQKGAIGMIVISVLNLGKLRLSTENARDPEFPVCAIDAIELYEDAKYFYEVNLEIRNATTGPQVMMANISGDEDIWIPYVEAGWAIFLQIFFCVINAAVLALNIWKVVQFYKAELLGFNLVSICLGFLFVACLLRQFYYFDPFEQTGFFGIHVFRFVFYGFWPFEFIASFMVILYWFEILTSNQIVVTTFFYRFRIPFIIICVILLAIQNGMAWIFAFPQAFGAVGGGGAFYFFQATGYTYVAVLLIVALFNIVIGSFVVHRVKQRAKGQNKSRMDVDKTIAQLSYRVAATAVCYFLIVGIFLYNRQRGPGVLEAVFGYPYYYILTGLFLISNAVQILTFQVKFRSAGTKSTVTRSTFSSHGSVSVKE